MFVAQIRQDDMQMRLECEEARSRSNMLESEIACMQKIVEEQMIVQHEKLAQENKRMQETLVAKIGECEFMTSEIANLHDRLE